VTPRRLPLGVLVSGSGTNLQAILDAASEAGAAFAVRVVISNRPRAAALQRAVAAGVPSLAVSHRRFADREEFEAALIEALVSHGVEWVVLAGFMRLLTPHFLRAFPERVINIHPSILPAFPGVHAQRQAIEHGVKISGCTVHFVDEGTDTGPIIGQAAVPVLATDTEESLATRILEQEHRLFPAVLQLLAEGRVHREGRVVRIDGGALPAPGLMNPAAPLRGGQETTSENDYRPPRD
jgi:phosphoribosylglycinamide formyltransferase-1